MFSGTNLNSSPINIQGQNMLSLHDCAIIKEKISSVKVIIFLFFF